MWDNELRIHSILMVGSGLIHRYIGGDVYKNICFVSFRIFSTSIVYFVQTLDSIGNGGELGVSLPDVGLSLQHFPVSANLAAVEIPL